MPKFHYAAMGGTFDVLHNGHKALLAAAFAVSDSVLIGVTTDKFASLNGKKLTRTHQKRVFSLMRYIRRVFPGRTFIITELNDTFGPSVLESHIEALIVSEETARQGDLLNHMRAQKKMRPVEIVVVPMVMAADGNRISSTRIRNLEIHPDGRMLRRRRNPKTGT